MRDGCRRPGRPSDSADRRQRAHRTIGTRQLLVEIVAHPVRRHEADDPPVTGIDYQPPVIAAAIDHGNRVDEAALLRNSERQKPALAENGVDLGRRQQGRPVAGRRDFRRRGIGTLDIGDDRVRRSSGFIRRQYLRICPGGHDSQRGRHDPPCEQLHRLFAPVAPPRPEHFSLFIPAATSPVNPAVLGPDRGAFTSNPGRGGRPSAGQTWHATGDFRALVW